MNTVDQLNDYYRALVGDEDFDRLELTLSKPNIFEVLRITESEIRHTNFLGWLLDPNESHAMGDLLLKRFLREIFSATSNLSELDVESLDLYVVDVRREWKNVDLLIVFKDLVVCIENKVYSKEHSNQLQRYKTIVESEFVKHRKAYVYLTLFGESSEDEGLGYINYSYVELLQLINRITTVFVENIPHSVRTYLTDYIVSIKRNFMKDDTVNDLAREIYSKHKEILDFIFENRPDFAEDLRLIIEDEIQKFGWVICSQNKGYSRFLPKELNTVIPRGLSTGWPLREAFLFEIDFFWYPKKLKLQTVVAPSDHSVHPLLNGILTKIPGAKKPQGRKWLKHFMIDKDFDKDKLMNESSQEIRRLVHNYLSEFKSTVETVSAELLKHEREIKACK